MATRQTTSKKKVSRNAPKDAIALLTEDHERVRRLLTELEQTTEKTATKREKLLATIEQTRARRVLCTHGNSDALVRFLREQGTDAAALQTAFQTEDEE